MMCMLMRAQGQYVSAACSAWSDTRCAPCTVECGVGQYLAAACTYDGDAVCAPCPGGAFSLGGSAGECELCPPGSVAHGTGCTPCGVEGRLAGPDRLACVDACPPGAYASAADACEPCPDGTFSVDGALCLACVGCVAPNRSACDPLCGGHPGTCIAV
jgi:hypothetical protein